MRGESQVSGIRRKASFYPDVLTPPSSLRPTSQLLFNGPEFPACNSRTARLHHDDVVSAGRGRH